MLPFKIRLIAFIIITVVTSIAVKTNAQNVTLNVERTPLNEVFKQIKNQADYTFAFTDELMSKANAVTIKVSNAPVTTVLDRIFSTQPLSYSILNKVIIVREKDIITSREDNYYIRGIVSDKNNEILHGATVFITNSKYATSTGSDGSFSFVNISPGTYQVVVKMLGFELFTQSITVEDKSVKLIAHLSESNTLLNAVTIKAKRSPISEATRKFYMGMFLTNFIGETPNSWECELLNPDVLKFTFNNDTHILRASADDFLIIENRALGYKLKYLLTDFNIDLDNNTAQTAGAPYFEDLKGTEAQIKKWDAARRLAYLSSGRHFFRAVVNGTAKAEGYEIYKFIEKTHPDKTKELKVIDKPLNIDSVFIYYDQNTKAYTAKNTDTLKRNTRSGLFITYYGVKPSPLFYKIGIPSNFKNLHHKDFQGSQMLLLSDIVLIDKNGELSFSDKVIFNGYWGWLRMADLTPLDYVVDPIKETANN